MLELARQEYDLIANLIIGDEAHFHLSRVVNKPNVGFCESRERLACLGGGCLTPN